MSLYNDASLVMIPSAYKDGKLYSIKPTDGSGDFTFTRGSNLAATRVDENGLIEKGRENLFTQSNNFSSIDWSKTRSSVTGGQSGYDGSSDAWLFQATGNTPVLSMVKSAGVTTLSIYAKSGNAGGVLLRVNDGSTYPDFSFNLDAGTTNSTSDEIDTSVEDVGNGWYRLSLTTNAASATYQFFVRNADGSDVTSGANIYIQDAQLEQGLVATDYIETTTTTAQAGILEDMPRLDYSGGASCPSLLLEPTRTNLVTQSELFEGFFALQVAAQIENDTTSPEGVQNAVKMYPTSTGAYKGYNKTFGSSLNNTAYTLSVYAKAAEFEYMFFYEIGAVGGTGGVWFNLSTGNVGTTQAAWSNAKMTDMGDGWYRCEATLTYQGSADYWYILAADADGSATATASGTNGLYLYGAQMEEASYPTSYIPCYGAATTRSFDYNTASFADIESEGTLFAEVEVVDTGAFGTPMALSIDNATSNFILVYKTNINKLSARVRFEGLDQCLIDSGTLTEGYHKFAFRYRENDCEFFVDGVSVGTDTIVSIPTGLNTIRQYIGSSINPFVGGIKQLAYFPTALTDSECIALTTL